MDRIIRTCSFAALALALASPASARFSKPIPPSAFRDYALARTAQQSGDGEAVLKGYAIALKREPDNQALALRIFRDAVRFGDMNLALFAARKLSGGKVPLDASLVLAAERVKLKDAKGIEAFAGLFDRDESFRFVAPFLRAWNAQATRRGDGIAILEGVDRRSTEAVYASEQRAYLMFLKGDVDGGLALVRSLSTSYGGLPALKLSAASSLLKLGRREEAKSLLPSGQPELVGVRRALEQGATSLPAVISSPTQGLAQFFARLTNDLLDQRAGSYALLMARIARYLDNENLHVAYVEAKTLTANDLNNQAQLAFAQLEANPLMRQPASQARIELLWKLKRFDEAVALQSRIAAAPDATAIDQVRLGDALSRAGKYDAAYAAYDAATKKSQDSRDVESWLLWYLKGGMLDKSGKWAEAKAALQKAIELAPNQPGPLNHLGYGLMERRENLPEALRLIKQAYSLKPDDAAIIDSYGWALYLNGDMAGAIEALESAVSAEPTEPTLGEHLGDVYWADGRRIDARYAWRAASIYAEGDAARRLKSKMDVGILPQTTRAN